MGAVHDKEAGTMRTTSSYQKCILKIRYKKMAVYFYIFILVRRVIRIVSKRMSP